MAKIKSFEAACKALGIEPILPEVSGLSKDHQKAIVAHYKLVIIAQALNEGWKPDWKNDNEWKYYPWFDMENGFSYIYFGRRFTCSRVGSRLCFKSSELARYAGTQFLKLYKDYFTFGK